jgi:hypothetical protein
LEREAKLLGLERAIVRDIDGLEELVKFCLLGVHVAPELREVDAPVVIGIAGGLHWSVDWCPKLSLEVVVLGEVWEWKRLWRVDLEERVGKGGWL